MCFFLPSPTTGITLFPHNLIVWLTKGAGSQAAINIYNMLSVWESPLSFIFFQHSGNGWTSTLTIPGIQSNNLNTVACATTGLEIYAASEVSGTVLRLYGKYNVISIIQCLFLHHIKFTTVANYSCLRPPNSTPRFPIIS